MLPVGESVVKVPKLGDDKYRLFMGDKFKNPEVYGFVLLYKGDLP
jgi:hypothetical protein